MRGKSCCGLLARTARKRDLSETIIVKADRRRRRSGAYPPDCDGKVAIFEAGCDRSAGETAAVRHHGYAQRSHALAITSYKDPKGAGIAGYKLAALTKHPVRWQVHEVDRGANRIRPGEVDPTLREGYGKRRGHPDQANSDHGVRRSP
jgi:hypothetical protein